MASVFGFEGFRPGQQEIVEAMAAGRDVLAIMPTGGGKSLCYQLPALVGDGLTLVISPLIALMEDQVSGLRAAGVEAGMLTSATPEEERNRVIDALHAGRLRLLYVAPERLASDAFCGWLSRLGVARLAVDEAHCIAQWGHDFRPDYLRLGPLAARRGGPGGARHPPPPSETRAAIGAPHRAAGLGWGGGVDGTARTAAPRGERAEAQVIRTEIMAPLRDAMRL
ncbi:MAG: DEAD/DEAH box helicase, partial [Pseudomonadota bacterium]